MVRRVFEARRSHDSAYANTPTWINVPEKGHFEFDPDRVLGVPPGPNFDVSRNPNGKGSGFPPLLEKPILQFEKNPIPALLIDVYWRSRNTWAVSDHAKSVLNEIDSDAFDFQDTSTLCPDGSPAPHFWLCDIVQFKDAIDFDGPEVNVKTTWDGLTSVELLGARNMVFINAAIGEAEIWRLPQVSHAILCTETAFKIWQAVTPKLRGVRWEQVGQTDA